MFDGKTWQRRHKHEMTASMISNSRDKLNINRLHR
jgi:hypothetical protein